MHIAFRSSAGEAVVFEEAHSFARKISLRATGLLLERIDSAARPPAQRTSTSSVVTPRTMFERLRDRLQQQRLREWAAYGDALVTQSSTIAAMRLPTLDVPIETRVNINATRTHCPEVGSLGE